jgi:hypothetical protein
MVSHIQVLEPGSLQCVDSHNLRTSSIYYALPLYLIDPALAHTLQVPTIQRICGEATADQEVFTSRRGAI